MFAQALPLLTALLAVGVMGYAAAEGNQALMAASAVLLAALTTALSGLVRWIDLIAYPVAFLGFMALFPQQLQLEDLLTAALILMGLFLIIYREQLNISELHWQQRTVGALRSGSERLAQAQTAEQVIEAGTEMIHELGLAPNLAYLAYRGGSPQILAARGAFEPFLRQPIFPSHNDSRSVQADHWVVEEALVRLPREQRGRYLAVPVSNRDTQHLGTIVLARPGAADFQSDNLGVLESFTRLMGAQLGQFAAIDELREAQDLSLKALGGTLEQRDDETGGHTGRVVELSLQLGRALGFSEARLTSLRWGAYLHDLGKIAIPDSILHKPGMLTPAERKVMETHTRVGYDLLQNLHFLPTETLDLVRYHHEKWDGSGYPAGLRGTEIPETARVFSIVDVYDALTSERPYKDAWSQQQALSEIRKQAGQHFDPHYVDVFVRMLQEEGAGSLLEQ
ncbi:HD-GYP domain-containing protein [Deinococcus sp. Marseille-Q6407]|uniref:HD-GYP domain-containing protein n=1 Tax=Deinococcus sp. Marseille-Q6407 TaxID=2969223 RepID=UPI0021C09CE7|nr:HD-GYP domain-containing protein [Deinococcus sp. Marseille-Q6407]